MKQNEFPVDQNYLQRKQTRNGRFTRLQQAAADNAVYNDLTEIEAMAVIDSAARNG